ncbi:DUF5716 family protein [Lachnobacterium bovis]|uniref:DUF5716 domain-containing protein n=1 Tax=Lachnobacterium bovis DSM 14045 TaxID=1122142 RepID=A0A1H3HMV9_9FIRM|nr:DUF5716 family protein [Lachnobacterium bovis]SDY16720.1 hypothetical protein SAMN02910414_00909 [Lachnobacterium bovis DSM 14045]
MEIFNANVKNSIENEIINKESIEREYYIGIDLNSDYAMVSYYCNNMETPETVSATYGSEVFQIPQVLAKKINDINWLYGQEAIKAAEADKECFIANDFFKEESIEKTYECFDDVFEGKDLLQIFLSKIISLPSKIINCRIKPKVVISIKRINREIYEAFEDIGFRLGFKNHNFKVIDYKESFYYYMINQEPQLSQNDVLLLCANSNILESYRLSKSHRTTPVVINIAYDSIDTFKSGEDKEFCAFLKQILTNQRVTSVYLVGSGFDGNWLLESIQFLCKGRRVFIGKNLFSKGACYAAMLKYNNSDSEYVYLGENDLKFNLSIKVLNRNQMEFLTLVNAGDNYFEAKNSCEVILSKGNTIDFWKQLPDSREAKIESISLKDLPLREDRVTRVKIVATPISNNSIDIYVEDMGFGEIYKSSNKSWHYVMSMPA